MNNKGTKWMYLACGLICAAGALMFAYLLALVQEMILTWEEILKPFETGIYLYCVGAAVPCIAAVGMLAAVIHEIGQGRAFTEQNAGWMRGIAGTAFLECAYILAGLVGWSMVGIMHFSVILIAGAVIMLGVGVGLLAWALARLVQRASAIQQENDLTV